MKPRHALPTVRQRGSLQIALSVGTVAAIVIVALVWHVLALRAELATVNAAWAQDREAAAAAAAATSEDYRAREEALRASLEGDRHAVRQEVDRLRRDAARARAAELGLRDAAAYAAARCGGAAADPAPADGSAPASGAGLVLADVLGSADGRAGELAEAFDAARAAGLFCERSYDRARELTGAGPGG